MKKIIIANIILLSIVSTAFGQHPQLRKFISHLQDTSSGKIGVSMRLLETNDSLSFHDRQHYVMQSVFKLPIAIAVLDRVDKGQLKLGDSIFVKKAELNKTVSAIYDKYAGQDVNISVNELLTDMVTLSDNNACDVLLRVLSGPKNVEQYIHGIGVTNFSMRYTEAQMHNDWNAQYVNWCYPSAQVELLQKLFNHSVLSERSNTLLRNLLQNTFVTPKRIRYLLPKGTVIEHRSGTSSTNEKGLSPATNDVGIITLPNGKHLAIAVFITESYDPISKRELIIAQIAKAAFDEFGGN